MEAVCSERGRAGKLEIAASRALTPGGHSRMWAAGALGQTPEASPR